MDNKALDTILFITDYLYNDVYLKKGKVFLSLMGNVGESNNIFKYPIIGVYDLNKDKIIFGF